MEIHVIEGLIGNIVLVEYSDRLLLLDTGCREDYATILSFIEGLGRSVSELHLIVITHGHPDHAGSGTTFRQNFQIPIAAHPDIDLWSKGLPGIIQHTVETMLARYVGRKQNRSFRSMKFPRFIKPDIMLKHGDTLPGFPDWEVFHAPGHTSHDIILYHKKRQSLYASDCILLIKGKYLLPVPVALPLCMDETLHFIGTLKVKELIMAHGGRQDYIDIRSITENLHNKIESYQKKSPLNFITQLSSDIKRKKLERHTMEDKKTG